MAETFNFYEAIFWFLIGLSLLATALLDQSKSIYRKNLITSTLLFFAFGVSDLIEMQTGAWWRPLGLLLLKGGCIIGFILCFIRYLKLKKDKQPK